MSSLRIETIIGLLILLVTVLVFSQVQHHDFINYDDPLYVTENPHIRDGLTWKGISWAFTAVHACNWHPVTWLSHMLDIEFYGLNPKGHHMTNVMFHAVNALLLFVVFSRMTKAVFPSALISAIFALHPLHVESVAWAAERKDVLSAFFWLLTMWAYSRYTKGAGLTGYFFVCFLFLCGLMAKSMVVTFPFVLLLVDFWPLGRFSSLESSRFEGKRPLKYPFAEFLRSRIFLEKLPLFALSVIVAFITIYAQRQSGSVSSLEGIPLFYRIVNALDSYIGYILKMIWPLKLAVFYPLAGSSQQWRLKILLSVGALILVLLATFFVLKKRKSSPYLVMGWLWYIVTLIPVIGIVQVGSQAMADRYAYIPMIGVLVMFVWGVRDLIRPGLTGRVGLMVSAVILLTVLAVLTWRQTGYWKDSVALYTHALDVTDGNHRAHYNLGVEYSRQGNLDEAVSHYMKAIGIKPDYGKAYNNLGMILMVQNNLDQAIGYFSEAIRIDPNLFEAHFNMGKILSAQARSVEAIKHYTEALRIKPYSSIAHQQLALELAKQGDYHQATEHLLEAIRIDPENAAAHTDMGLLLSRQDQFQEAMRHYSRALEINPDLERPHFFIGLLLSSEGNHTGAIKHYQEALRINQGNDKAHSSMGISLVNIGRPEDAIPHFARAVELKPDSALNHMLLSRAYWLTGDKQSALAEYKWVEKLDPAMAAELGKFLKHPPGKI